MLVVSVLSRTAAVMRLNATTPIIINGTRNLMIFARAVEANVVNVQTITSLKIVNVRPVNPELITPVYFQLMR
jgi:hypothetical protein